MGQSGSITTFAYVILVTLIFLTCVERTQGCHRRVEYHHYKKPPPKGYGHGGHGHYHGGGHGGHKGHGKGYSGGGGHGLHGGHKGYGGGHGGNHGSYGKGHGGHGEYGGGHGGYGMSHGGHGYGMGHGGYGMGSGHGGYGMGHAGHDGDHHGAEGYGHGHGQNVGHGHSLYGQDDMHGGGAYGGSSYGHGNDKAHGDSGQKGQRYKYQVYESTQYNSKGGHQPSHAYPLYMQKGYGHSGPYPNTEYTNRVEASVAAPHPTSFSGSMRYALPQYDAAETADLIRNGFDTKESPAVTTLGVPEAKVDSSVGNFDLNLNYNSADLPDPFRRNAFDSPIGINGNIGRRKKISSKYRDDPSSTGPNESAVYSHNEQDAFASQSQNVPSGGGPDYLENDTGDVGSTSISGAAELPKMNF